MVTTSSKEVAEKAKILRDQGKEDFHSSIIIELGYNWRLPEISAAIGLAQLKRLPQIIRKRSKIAQHYDEKLHRLPRIKPLRKPPNQVHNYYKYVAILDSDIDRDEFKRKLGDKGVKCGGEVYWPPLHLQPIYKKLLRTKEGDFPIAEDICRRMICLPIYTGMGVRDVEYVTDQLQQTLSQM